MFTHQFQGTQHHCGILEVRPLALSFNFVSKNSDKNETKKVIEIGNKFSNTCYWHITPEISSFLDDSEDSDDENEVISNPSCREHWNSYRIQYSFENEITLELMETLLEALRKAPNIKVFFTESCLDELTSAVKSYFEKKSASTAAPPNLAPVILRNEGSLWRSLVPRVDSLVGTAVDNEKSIQNKCSL